MTSYHRRLHETTTVINQKFLDYSQDNLEQKLQLIVDIEIPQEHNERFSCLISNDSPCVVTSINHKIGEGEQIIFETSGNLPNPLLPETIYYARNATHEQFFISETPTGSYINTTTDGSGNHLMSLFESFIRASDRNIFVGKKFYEALTQFPLISRTIGEWLRPTIEFSSINISINNILGRLNDILPGGNNYKGFINNSLNVKLGLRDVESSYFNIFKGYISETGGFKRDVDKISFVARDQFERINIKFPKSYLKKDFYPKLKGDLVGKKYPIVLGDFTKYVSSPGDVPSIVTNSGDPEVYFEKELPIGVQNGTPTIFTSELHRLDINDIVRFKTDDTLPTPLNDYTDYYILPINEDTFNIALTPSGGAISTTDGVGQHSIVIQTLRNVQCLISLNEMDVFLDNDIWLNRSDVFYKIEQADITNISLEKNKFEIIQNTGNTLIDGENFKFQDNDIFMVKVKGKSDYYGYTDNIVTLAKNLLLEFSDITISEFDSNWSYFANKNSPAESAIYSMKARIYLDEEKNLLEYVLSLLEQVRLEMFISRDLKLKLVALHFDEYEASPDFVLRPFDIEKDSFTVSIDENNNFNRVGGFYNFHPLIGENVYKTSIYKNQACIDQTGKEISKAIEFPNLYREQDVSYQLKEILKLASSYYEIIELNCSTRALLKDIGDFIKLNVQIGSSIYENVPMMIREIGYDPEMKLVLKLLSFQLIPFDGYNPSFGGIVGGSTALIEID